MRKGNNFFVTCLCAIGLCGGLPCASQLVYNKGQVIFTGSLSIVRVQGSFENDSSGTVNHNGLIVIDSSFYNYHDAAAAGYGQYDVYGNWVNSAHFIRDTSFVHLKGATQYIKGDSVTRFYNLSAEGSSRKILRINAYVYNYLYLNNLELAADQDTLFIENKDTSAIKSSTVFGSEGFVSTLDTGALSRKTNSANTYYYPFGSITGTPRFRPLNIQPGQNTLNDYVCSFQNRNPDADLYFTANKDSDVCRVNDKFFHTIQRTSGNSPADITIAYLKSADGPWNRIGNWNFSGNKWKNTGNGINTSVNSYDAITRKGWNNFSSKPYALINYRPVIDSIQGQKLLCELNGSFSAISNSPLGVLYKWVVNGGAFAGDSTGQTINLKFNTAGTKTVSLIIIDTLSGCASIPLSKNLIVSQKPVAGFGITYPDLLKGTPVAFIDSSKYAVTWSWDFGNGRNSFAQHPQTVYENAGVYFIKQIASNSEGCRDSLSKELIIRCSQHVPNVFSPNGDGKNDHLLIKGMCISEYEIEIYNRWGLLVYKGGSLDSAWDGHSPSGENCPEGTYYFVLRIREDKQTEALRGFITLLR